MLEKDATDLRVALPAGITISKTIGSELIVTMEGKTMLAQKLLAWMLSKWVLCGRRHRIITAWSRFTEGERKCLHMAVYEMNEFYNS